MIEGELVTFLHGAELGRERYRDDGEALTSDVVFAGAAFRVSIARASGAVRVTQGEATVERVLAPGELALENGSWQAYALLLERIAARPAGAAATLEFTALIPGQGARVAGRATAGPADDEGARTLAVTLAGNEVEVRVARDGAVVRAAVPAQGLEVCRAGEAPASAAARAAGRSEGVVEEDFQATGAGGVTLRGTLARPDALPPGSPVAVIIAGSGPTDRDCNGRAGLRTDAYRLLAHGLAQRGVASVRYDKRGVGASDAGVAETEVRLSHFVGDATGVVDQVRRDARFGPLTVVGHSEGGLIALELAQRTPIDALVLLAAAGRPLGEVLRAQLARSVAPETLPEVDRVIAAIARGEDPAPVPPSLGQLFRPSVRPFLASVLALDPAERIAKLPVRVTLVQGECDAQVTVEDARRLATARPDARLELLPRVNHVLKEEASPALPQASYLDPSRPLGPRVLDAVLRGVAH